MKPALTARFLRTRIPRKGQSLHPSVRELDEVLLQRSDSEGVLDRERRELAVFALGLDDEAAVCPRKKRAFEP